MTRCSPHLAHPQPVARNAVGATRMREPCTWFGIGVLNRIERPRIDLLTAFISAHHPATIAKFRCWLHCSPHLRLAAFDNRAHHRRRHQDRALGHTSAPITIPARIRNSNSAGVKTRREITSSPVRPVRRCAASSASDRRSAPASIARARHARAPDLAGGKAVQPARR